jgi:tetratricopeptide (TPR) repeat protein
MPKPESHRAKQEPRTADQHNLRGRELNAAEQYAEAIAEFDQAISRNPRFAQAYNGRGYSYLKLRKYGEAIRDFNQAIRLRPDYVNAYHNRAVAKRDSNDPAGAAADLEMEKALTP